MMQLLLITCLAEMAELATSQGQVICHACCITSPRHIKWYFANPQSWRCGRMDL